MSLSRIIYSSDSIEHISWKLVKDILTVAEPNNKSLNITGVLLSQGTHFLQVLEGEEQEIKTLYEHIANDPRHSNICLLVCENITTRQFGDWSMKGFEFVDLDESSQKYILDKYCEGNSQFYLPNDPKLCIELINDIGLTK